MSKTMKAWRVYGYNDMRLDEIPVPEIKPGWALVKTRVVQPSVTEVNRLKGGEAIDLVMSSVLRLWKSVRV